MQIQQSVKRIYCKHIPATAQTVKHKMKLSPQGVEKQTCSGQKLTS